MKRETYLRNNIWRKYETVPCRLPFHQRATSKKTSLQVQFCRIHKNSSETRMSVKSNTYAHMHCKYLKPKYSQLGVLASLSLWKTWHVRGHVLSVVFAFLFDIWYFFLYIKYHVYIRIYIYTYMKHYTICHIYVKIGIYIYTYESVAKNTVLYTNTKATQMFA